MHPRNRHQKPYQFATLVETHPPLAPHVFENEHGTRTVDFSDRDAVFHLNKALLKHYYGISEWNIPEGYLCPPIPSRSDYIHHLHDLVNETDIQPPVRVLDIGTGANCIYPLLATSMYNWESVGCDIDPEAVSAAKQNVKSNPEISDLIEIRQQTDNANIFKGIIKSGEYFHATICNPPFYSSAEEANKSTLRKLKQLNPEKSILELERNFDGQPNELWCNGGEALFIKRMAKQSVSVKHQVGWFTTLVAKGVHLPKIFKLLAQLGAEYRT